MRELRDMIAESIGNEQGGTAPLYMALFALVSDMPLYQRENAYPAVMT